MIDPGGAPLPPLLLTPDRDPHDQTHPQPRSAAIDALTLTVPGQVRDDDTAGAPIAAPSAPVPDTIAADYRPDTTPAVPSGAKARIAANLAAITTLIDLRTRGRHATAGEQQTLARWSGWGAIPDTRTDTYTTEREDLREALGADQYQAASRSTLNAHYTDPAIADQMWKALQHAGFTDGRVLEPGCGSGTFIGLAPETAQMVGVEKDPISAAIAAYLYPSAHIRAEGYETTNVPNGTFVAAIGNVPFGNFALRDPAYNPRGLSIHNHFIVKSLDLIAPGGYQIVLTSRFTMDGVDPRARREILARADLLGALRLPTSAFRRVAGTDVVTDILVLRRREADRTADADAWLHTAPLTVVDDTDNAVDIEVNSYFHDHPDHILGRPGAGHGIHGHQTLEVAADQTMPLALQVGHRLRAIIDTALRRDQGLTARAATLTDVDHERFDPGLLTATTTKRPPRDTLRFDAAFDEFQTWNGQAWTTAKVFNTRKQETIHLLKLRDVANAVVTSQRDGQPSSVREQLRGELNRLYDVYVAQHGPIQRFKWSQPTTVTQDRHDKALAKSIERWRQKNPQQHTVPDELLDAWDEQAWQAPSQFKMRPHIVTALRNDPGWTTVLALEGYDELTGHTRKAPIFSVDLLSPPQVRDRADTAEEALIISLDRSGGVDIAHIGALLGTDAATARERIRGLVFPALHDPDVLVPATRALSGNVRRQLRDAEAAAAHDPRYHEYVAALREVQPVDREASQITARPGSPWIDARYLAQFASETFKAADGTPPRIKADHVQGIWTIEYRGPRTAAMTETWGTRFTNRDAISLLEMVCNNQEIAIRYTKEETETTGRTGVNRDATVAAQAKATKIIDAFQKWVFADDTRRAELVAVYNERFNSLRAPEYRGAALTLPGMSHRFSPHPHQRDAVARVIAEPNVLLDHVVGAGKSGTMFMAAMELRRLGLARQPWIVVPNHIIEQVGKEAKWWYPGAEILLGTPGTDPAGRRRFIAQSATTDWDMVIAPQSLFTGIPVGPDAQREYIGRESQLLRESLQNLNTDDVTAITVKRLEAALQRYESKLEKLTAQDGKDTGLLFEHTGCDYLMIDEAHMYKNRTRLTPIKELACPDGSERADDLAMKLELLRNRRREDAIAAGRTPSPADERVATFATGTPIANSLGELYVMQRYLRPDLLDDAGVIHINDWATTFTATVNTVEVNSTGTQLKPVTRVGQFCNLQELLRISSIFTDVVTRDQTGLTLPELDNGGKRTIVSIPADQTLRDFITDLGYRAGHLDPKNLARDNILKISNDGREASLDPRMVHLPEPTHSRTTAVAEQIMDVHRRYADTIYKDPQYGHDMPTPGGLQIVFCDRGTPAKGAKRAGFNLYESLREDLIARGMPPEKIRFIHDADKAEDKLRLFDDCIRGRVSVLIGSTEKMGTGTNVQTRATALHHVDVPWRPADLEQREGRIIRQGNQNDTVSIFNYVVEGSYDVVMWQKIEAKSLFIAQIKRADISVDEVDDIGGAEMTVAAAETKALATGDPRYIRQVQLQDDVEHLAALERAHHDGVAARDRDIRERQHQLDITTAQIDALAPTADAITAQPDDAPTRIVVEGRHYPERKDSAAPFAEICRRTYVAMSDTASWDRRPLNTAINGLALQARRDHLGDRLWVSFQGPSAEVAITMQDLHDSAPKVGETSEASTAKARGLLTRMENLYKDLPAHHRRLKAQRDNLTRALADLTGTDVEPFERGDELAAKREEHTTLTTLLQLEAQSEEAKAKAARAQQRLLATGRQPGWSLHLNPTPFLIEEAGCATADQYRFAHALAEQSRARKYHDAERDSADESRTR